MATGDIQPRGIMYVRVVARSRERGLSLVPVILTTVLVGLLAGLVGVAVWTARGAAERTVCTMHLRQLTNALIMYKTECGDYPPGSYEVCDSNGEIQLVTWEHALAPYLGKKQNLFDCPACAKENKSNPSLSPNYEYAKMNCPVTRGKAQRNVITRQMVGRIDPAAAVESGALLVCMHHDNNTPSYKRWVLVAYDDGSVKWEPAPGFIKARTPPAFWPQQRRRAMGF